MAVLPGIVGVQNALQKTVGLPSSAFTAANSASSYVFTTASTATIGSGGTAVTVTRRTASNVPNGQPGPQNPWINPGYDGSSMIFSGTQSVAYLDNNSLHVVPPYSCQVDFKPSVLNKSTMYVVNNGQGGGIGWEEFTIYCNNDNIFISTCAASDGSDGGSSASGPPYTAYYYLGKAQIGAWHRVGVMWYNVGGTYNSSTNTYTGGTNYIRGYLNGEQKWQRPLNGTAWTNPIDTGRSFSTQSARLPYNSVNGIVLGNDNANFTNTFFEGSIRNFFIGRTLFWTI